jgi:2'-deoxynucleoside 5'-phosphate N-hydrolase
MRVYLSAAMTNPHRETEIIRALEQQILALGHVVLTPQIAAEDALGQDRHLSNAEVAQRDLALATSCDALLAEVSTPSHGVGIEVLAATQQAVPTLLLHRGAVRVSRLLLGLPGPTTVAYHSVQEAMDAASSFLEATGSARA